ncbi:MAG: 1-deoxy-D-xylulose-5-phosphate synthase [Chloroflexota bacterium]|nr:1-deoxy-D-xylulose-5-phosphate synthase [Chloroflexota bacterium]
MPLLDSIKSPRDIRTFSDEQLTQLAQEIRQEILDTILQIGGHFAPSLGAVELTIALHRVFDAPKDQIIWDVGHQSYPHKMLTGRRDRLSSIKKFGGISGFPLRSESEYDTFGTGHASTAVSAALGMAKARDLLGKQFSVVAVVGDGALTGGLAFEGLNNAGQLDTPLVVVLNDNGMSISPNVGALSHYLYRIASDPMYLHTKRDIERLLQSFPMVGGQMVHVARRMKDSVKEFVLPGNLWEEFGFVYIGPINGHDIRGMIDTLERAKSLNRPVFVHVRTVKGKGYEPAEKDATTFHSVSAPKKPSPPAAEVQGRVGAAAAPPKPAPPSYSSVFGKTAVELARKDPRIVAITAAMTEGTGLNEFARLFPERFFDVGIAEQHAVCFAAGLATQGLHPLAAIYSTFLQRAFDQVIHDVAIQDLPITLCIDRAGLVGDDGVGFQGVFDVGFLRMLPNVSVLMPRDQDELPAMLEYAAKQHHPVAVRYPRGAGIANCLPYQQPIATGKAETLRHGADVTLLAFGPPTYWALEAAYRLDAQGIQATVVNARFAKPLDEQLILEQAARTGRMVTVEEHALAGGFGSAVLELLEREGLAGSVKLARIGLPDHFVEHGDVSKLLAKYGVTVEAIEAAALRVLGEVAPRAASQ